jgi:hypothetical protein
VVDSIMVPVAMAIMIRVRRTTAILSDPSLWIQILIGTPSRRPVPADSQRRGAHPGAPDRLVPSDVQESFRSGGKRRSPP